jgi:cysteine desulfurase / selenocysteine lyase
VSVPLRGAEPGPLLARLQQSGIVCVVRDGNLRMSVRFYNHEDDIDRLTRGLVES